MSIKSKLAENSNLVKLAILAIAVILIITGLFSYFSKDDNSQESSSAAPQPISIDQDMSVKSVEDVEKVIAYWIDNNPEAIIASVTNMQKRAMEEQLSEAKKNISSKKSDIYDKKAPSFSQGKYDVTVVEFYDYNCGYCKQVNKSVNELLSADKKVRIIYRDFPVLGKVSREFAEVSIAVNLTDSKKFKAFHDKLMNGRASSKEEAIAIAGQAGVDTAKLRKTLSSKKSQIDSIIQENIKLGSEIGINGTPAFVIGEELIPGAIGTDALKEKVADQR